MARERKPPEVKAGVAPWMATYGDMITLLMCFFVMLYAMSNVDMNKYNAFADSFSKSATTYDLAKRDSILDSLGSGILDMPSMTGDPDDTNTMEETEYEEENSVTSEKFIQAQAELIDIADTMQTYIIENDLNDIINIDRTEMFVNITFQDSLLFDSGKATLKDDAYPVLEALANVMAEYPGSEVSIEGHADNRKINTIQYPNNRYLSSARALEVMTYLVEVKGFDEGQIIASGRGDAIPVADNNTAEGRAKNRRVEIRIMSKQYS